MSLFQIQAQWYRWYPAQPDNGRKGPKDCAIILLRSTSWKGKWKPRYCGASFLFLCQTNATVRGIILKLKQLAQKDFARNYGKR